MRFALLLALAAHAFAQTATIEGRVVNLATGEPVRRASVSMRRTGEVYTVETSSGGLFRIDGLAPGLYTLTAERPRFLGAGGKQFEIGPGARMSGIVIALTPAAVLTGRVLDPDGDPLSGVTVKAMQYRYIGGKRQLQPVRFTTSDDRGQYRLFDLPAGRYYVQASRRSGGALLLAYHPSAIDLSGAAEVAAAAGVDTRGIDVTVRPRTLHTVRVRLTNPPKVPILMATLFLRGAEPSLFNFRIRGDVLEAADVPPGLYVCTVRHYDRQGNSPPLSARRVFEVSSDIELSLTLAPPVSIDGVLHGLPDASKATVRLESIDEADRFSAAGARPEPDGKFSLANVAPDSYYARVSPPEGFYVASVQIGERKLESQRVDLTGASGRLAIRLADDGAEIAGLVLDAEDRPVPMATVALEPAAQDWPDRSVVLRTDSNGNFRIHDVAPGEYRVLAWTGEAADESAAVPLRAEREGEHRLTIRIP